MKAVVAAFNQEKALVGAFSVITNLRMELFEALVVSAVENEYLCIYINLFDLYFRYNLIETVESIKAPVQ